MAIKVKKRNFLKKKKIKQIKNELGDYGSLLENKKNVEILLHFNKNGASRLRDAIDVKNGSFVIKNTWIFWDTQSKGLYSVRSVQSKHSIQKLYRSIRFGLVCHKHLKNAIAERVNILVFFTIVRQPFRMRMNILNKVDELTSVHNCISVRFRRANL